MRRAHTLRIGGRPVAAFLSDQDRSGLIRLVGKLRANTPRRIAIKRLCQLLAHTGLYRALPSKHSPASEQVVLLADALLDGKISSCCLFWQADDRDRTYGYCNTKDGAAPLFIKHGTGANNAALFEAERRALSSLETTDSFEVPRLIASRISDGESLLILSCLPDNVQPSQLHTEDLPRTFSEHVTATHVAPESEVRNTRWWQLFSEHKAHTSNRFQDLVEEALCQGSGVTLATAHGDAGSENIFTDGHKVYAIDWERYANDAPASTDEVAYWMGHRHRAIEQAPGAEVDALVHWAIDRSHTYRDILLAVAFLVGADFRPALQLAASDHWPESWS